MNKYSITPIISSLLGVLLGIVLIAIDVNVLVNIISIVIGVFIIVTGLGILAETLESNSKNTYRITLSVIYILFGIVCIAFRNEIMAIIIGILLILFPLLRIIASPTKKQQLKYELVNIVVGLLLILCGPGNVLNYVCKIFGGIIIVLSIIILVYQVILLIKKPKKDNQDIIDAEYTYEEQ